MYEMILQIQAGKSISGINLKEVSKKIQRLIKEIEVKSRG
jgi:hypothetical protein